MKKALLLLSSAFILGTPVVAFAQDDNSDRIAEIESQIEELEAELKELRGDSEVESDGKYKIGDEVEIGDYVVTITDAEYTDERSSVEDVDPDEVIVLSWRLTNNSDEDLMFTSGDFKLYVDGMEMDTYSIEADLGNVTPGRSVESKSAYAVMDDGEIEIEWSPTFNFDDLLAVWSLDDI